LKKLVGIVTAVSLLFAGTSATYAHPGGKDELGGHFRRADCTYHFHSPTSLTKNKTKAQIIALIKKNNSNNKCTRGLTEKKVDWSSLGL
jgi:micrococcal nuclease